MTRSRIRHHRATAIDELVTMTQFYLRGLRETPLAGLPRKQNDAAALNLAVAISNLQDAAARFRGKYRVTRRRKRAVEAG